MFAKARSDEEARDLILHRRLTTEFQICIVDLIPNLEGVAQARKTVYGGVTGDMKPAVRWPKQVMTMTGNLIAQVRAWRPRARSLATFGISPPGRLSRTRILAFLVGAAFAVSAYAHCASAFDNSVSSVPSREGTTSTAAGPLKASANNRYLVDQHDVPFLMVGDSPQLLIGNLSQAEAAMFFANRLAYGINALWINLLPNNALWRRSDGATFDGIAPFTVPGDLSRPNPAYFGRADDMIRLAAAHGMVVILDPIETAGWLNTLMANGVARAFAYGQYLGDRYKDLPNIIWMHGNDFQSWQSAAHDALVQAVARGIRGKDPNHIHTVELNFLTSGSLDDPTWGPLVELNAAYTFRS
jgi:hypothetical protein